MASKTHIIGGIDAITWGLKHAEQTYAYYAIQGYGNASAAGTVVTHSQIEADTDGFDVYNLKPAQGARFSLPANTDALVLAGTADVVVDAASAHVIAGNSGDDTFNISGDASRVDALYLGAGHNHVSLSSIGSTISVITAGAATQAVDITGASATAYLSGGAPFAVTLHANGATVFASGSADVTVDVHGANDHVYLYTGETTVNADDGTDLSVYASGGSGVVHDGSGDVHFFISDPGLEVFASSSAAELYEISPYRDADAKGTTTIHGFDHGQDNIQIDGLIRAQFDAIHFSYRGDDTVIKDGTGHELALVTGGHVSATDLVFG